MQMPTLSASSLFSAYAAISALLILLRFLFTDLIPLPLRDHFLSLLTRLLFNHRTHQLTLVIEATTADGIGRNQLFDAADVYLSSILTTPSTSRLKLSKSPTDTSLTVRFHRGEQIDDSYENIPLRWCFLCFESDKRRFFSDDDPDSVSTNETRFYELTFDKQHKDEVINSYLPYILAKSDSINGEARKLKLCTLGSRFSCGNVYWDTINLDHPATFDTLAMEPDQKTAIIDDLERFRKRKEYYKRVGRAWKRGYLLYGPPGTGKSSLIAAIANYLRFDIYDLQLGNLTRDSDLRRLLLSTANRSILVIEDIDCSAEIKDRGNNISSCSVEYGQFHKPPQVQLTLSGLLNFIDGLWSSCGDERIIVFATNHKDKLDPALLRPGRMDMHIHMSFLTSAGFRILATNYLQIDGYHELFGEIEMLLQTVDVTPAQVAEELMRTEDVDEALVGVIKLLKRSGITVDNHSNLKGMEQGIL